MTAGRAPHAQLAAPVDSRRRRRASERARARRRQVASREALREPRRARTAAGVDRVVARHAHARRVVLGVRGEQLEPRRDLDEADSFAKTAGSDCCRARARRAAARPSAPSRAARARRRARGSAQPVLEQRGDARARRLAAAGGRAPLGRVPAVVGRQAELARLVARLARAASARHASRARAPRPPRGRRPPEQHLGVRARLRAHAARAPSSPATCASHAPSSTSSKCASSAEPASRAVPSTLCASSSTTIAPSTLSFIESRMLGSSR